MARRHTHDDVAEAVDCWTRGCRRLAAHSVPLRLTPRVLITVALCAACEHDLRELAEQVECEPWPGAVPEDALPA